MFIFLLMSFMSGMIELGPVLYAAREGWSTPMIILLPLFYQVGNILMSLIKKKKKTAVVFSTVAVVLTIASYILNARILLMCQITCCSFSIQTCRESNKTNCPKWLKRAARICGFFMAPAVCIEKCQPVMLCAALFTLIVLVEEFPFEPCEKRLLSSKPAVSAVMVFHQMHYFVYTYLMPLYIYDMTGKIYAAALFFGLTWVVYLIPQVVAEKVGIKKLQCMFFICHTFLAVCLAVMCLAFIKESYAAVCAGWCLTGLGGGSVFCIKEIDSGADMNTSENIGHIAGPAAAVLLSLALPGRETVFLPLAAFFFVMLAIGIAFLKTKESEIHG